MLCIKPKSSISVLKIPILHYEISHDCDPRKVKKKPAESKNLKDLKVCNAVMREVRVKEAKKAPFTPTPRPGRTLDSPTRAPGRLANDLYPHNV